MSNINGNFMNGAIMVASLVVGLLFARSFRDTRDRFFLLLSLAFTLLGIERLVIGASGGGSETHPSVYLIRCVAFLVIIYAVVDKNKG
jgi:hypothetical protein